MATTKVLEGAITTGGGKVVLQIDAEYGVNTKGDVQGSSDNVTRGRVMIEVQRNGTVIARKQFGQYILDSDNTANELFDLTEISNMGVVLDQPPAGTHTYSIYSWVDQVAGSSDIIGFSPKMSACSLLTTELKR